MQVTKSRLVLVLNLIGREGGPGFLDQLRGEVKENQSNPGYFRHLIENRSIRKKVTDHQLVHVPQRIILN